MFKKYYYQGKATNYSVSEEGVLKNDKTGRLIQGTQLSSEYIKVTLTIEGQFKTLQMHRIVAETWIPNPEKLPIVHHKDNNPHNNNVNNLQWISVKENSQPENCKPRIYNTQEREYIPFEKIGEDWKEIPFLNGYYANKDGRIYSKSSSKCLNGSYRNGYKRINVKGKMYSVHLLIYETFVDKVPKGYVLDHINGIRDDNRLDNLKCVTQSENMFNAQRNGHKGQHRVAQYDLDMNFIKEFPSFSAAAKEYGVTYSAISSAAKRGGTSCGYYWKEL